MNHCYRLVFNRSTQVWQVVSEIAKSHSKSAAIVLLPLLSLMNQSYTWAEPVANALPTGGQVVAGQSVITQNGNQLNIVQGTQKSIINWQSYNIGSNAEVNYIQNSSSAISLNRVVTGDPSAIFGKLNANGQVWLINPNGVLFGQGAQVNVGGLLASTLNIADDDFINGKYQFTGSSGSVVNMGAIVASQSGYVAMLAPEVRNEGVISAMQGTVAMAAGNAMTLDFNGSGLINVQVDSASVNTLVENKHLIQVGNGQVLMSTKAADGLITSVINNSGKIEANGMVSDGGVIRLTGAKTVINSGEISATSSSHKGGMVHFLGDNVGMFNASSVNVSGKTGGGTILVGGDYQGKNTSIQNATKTFVSKDTRLIADASESGDGGKVIVWAEDIARYYGNTSAKGGAIAGNGGFVEVSGKNSLDFVGQVDTSAQHGNAGILLLDPTDITISATGTNSIESSGTTTFAETSIATSSILRVDTLQAALASNNVIVTTVSPATAAGNITVSDAVSWTSGRTLTLLAENDITVAAAITTTGTGSVVLRADSDNSGAGALAVNAAIAANIGGIALSGASVTSNAAGTINTTGAANANGGNLSITTTGAINLAGAITSNGGTASGNSNGRNAGNITLSAGTSINAGNVTTDGTNASGTGGSARSGGNGGVISIIGNTGVIVGGVSSSGGNALGTNANGGNAGGVTINNQDGSGVASNHISTGTLTVRTGSATGSGVGGVAGTISVNNQANTGNVTTGGISTSGGNKGNGGNVSITSEANVIVAGSINTGGGTPLTNNPGRNAGNVTIVGVDRTITGAISANGSSGNGTNQAGGNAGVVSITGTGELITNSIAARAGSANGTGAVGAAGSVTLGGSRVEAGAINTSRFTTGTGGNVNITTSGNADSSIASINADNLGAISINVADTLTVSGVIAGTGTTLTKSGSGTLVLQGANTFTGAVNVNAGVLNLQNAIATGSTAGGVTVANGAALELQGGIAVGAEALTLNGTGLAGAGALRNVSGANSWAGVITLASDAQINSDLGTLTISGNMDGAARNLLVGGAANTIINGVIGTTTGALTKAGAGSLTLGGSNTYTGATNINAGTLLISAVERISDASAITVAAGAVFNLNNLTETVGSIAGAGNIDMGTGALVAGGANTSTTFSGVISGAAAGSFSKTGTGTLTLSGNNTYDGVTNVVDGTLSVGNANALGTTVGVTNVLSGKTLNVNNVALAGETINLNSTAALTGTDTATLAGNVIAADNSQIGTTSAASTLTINGLLSSTANNTLEITGLGSVVATNASNNIDIVKITNADDVSLRDIDSIRFAATASNLTGTLTALAANDIILQAGGSITSTTGDILLTGNGFINNAGANALMATGGRWVVHTANVAGNTYGGLTSGNQAIYGRALGVATTETGNRYVFANSPTLNVTSTNQTKTYGQDGAAIVANSFTAATFVDAAAFGGVFTQDTIANSLTGLATSVGAATTANVGSYAIDVTPITSVNGYTLNKSNAGNLTVNAAVVNLAGSRTYDGTDIFNAGAFGAFATGVNGETLTVTGSGGSVASKNAGTAQTLTTGGLVLANGTGLATNYTLTAGTHTGTITAATLNLNAVTDSKVYDGNISSSAAVTTVGLAFGDTVTGLTQSFASKNVLGSNLSTLNVNSGYVVDDGNSGNNYIVATNTATGTITAAALNLNAVTDSKVYDGNVTSSGVVTTSGLVGGDSVTGLTQSFASKNVLGSNLSTLNVNSGYTVNDGNSGNNYTVTAISALGTITEASLSIAANNATKVQGSANPTFTSTISGFVGGDTSSVLVGTLDYDTLADTASPVGTYTVTPFGVSANNYEISFIDGVLDVTAFVSPPPPPVIPVVNAASGSDISTFNNATTRPEQAVQTCNQHGTSMAMINGLDEFGLDDVDYQSSISQPQVGGVVANGLAGASCSIL